MATARVRLAATGAETTVAVPSPNATTVAEVVALGARALGAVGTHVPRFRGKPVDERLAWRLAGIVGTLDLVAVVDAPATAAAAATTTTTASAPVTVRVDRPATEERRKGEFPATASLADVIDGLWGPGTVAANANRLAVRYLSTVVEGGSGLASKTLYQLGLTPGTAAALTCEDRVVVAAAAPSPTSTPPQQQHAATTTTPTSAFPSALRAELWDEDARVCVGTLMRIYANIATKPGDDRVRRLRLTNPAFLTRIKSSRSAIDFLLSTGFREETEMSEPVLVLRNDTLETTERAFAVLTDLADALALPPADRTFVDWPSARAVWRQLQSAPKPPVPVPPPTVAFDPFQTLVVGAPQVPKMDMSSTERRVADLKAKRDAALAASLATIEATRDLVAFTATAEFNPRKFTSSSGGGGGGVAAAPAVASTSTGEDRAEVAALAAHQRVVHDKMRKAESFQTKAMRDLDKLSKSRVYARTLLRVMMPDRTVLQGFFSPAETVEDVARVVGQACAPQVPAAGVSLSLVPPTERLARESTLADAGLQPAATLQATVAGVLAPHLFSTDPNRIHVAVPTGEALDPETAAAAAAPAVAASTAASGGAKPAWFKMG